eukprot:2311-Heterococcus_DN1.PRE.2
MAVISATLSQWQNSSLYLHECCAANCLVQYYTPCSLVSSIFVLLVVCCLLWSSTGVMYSELALESSS